MILPLFVLIFSTCHCFSYNIFKVKYPPKKNCSSIIIFPSFVFANAHNSFIIIYPCLDERVKYCCHCYTYTITLCTCHRPTLHQVQCKYHRPLLSINLTIVFVPITLRRGWRGGECSVGDVFASLPQFPCQWVRLVTRVTVTRVTH